MRYIFLYPKNESSRKMEKLVNDNKNIYFFFLLGAKPANSLCSPIKLAKSCFESLKNRAKYLKTSQINCRQLLTRPMMNYDAPTLWTKIGPKNIIFESG